MIYDTIIIGGGPSGLMAAVECEKHNINYILFEKKEKVAKKLFISGGKRCNVTNNLDIDTFINNLTLQNKKFLYPSLYTMSPDQVKQFFEENHVPLVLENNFKYFPKSNTSQSIIDVLLSKIKPTNIITSKEVLKVQKVEELFQVFVEDNKYNTRSVIIAAGSKSFPSTGSTGFAIQVASNFNLSYTPFSPAETHIYSDEIQQQYKDLMGTTIQNTTVTIKGTKHTYTGDILFTHFGLSGPAVYHLSEFIYETSLKHPVYLEFPLTNASTSTVEETLNQESLFVQKALETLVTKRVSRKLLERTKTQNSKLAEVSKKKRKELQNLLLHFSVLVTKVEDKEKAYVNKGGIDLKELHPHTLESKKVAGLYFVGENMNIHGPIGGYNITMAFATGKLAAQAVKEKYKN